MIFLKAENCEVNNIIAAYLGKKKKKIGSHKIILQIISRKQLKRNTFNQKLFL